VPDEIVVVVVELEGDVVVEVVGAVVVTSK
jgi:hypothetical protein